MNPQDTITIAPSVLITIASHAATQIEGVARMGSIPVDVGRLLRGHPMGSGVVLEINDDNSVAVDVYLVAKAGINMREVGREVQHSITRSIQDLVGMQVTGVTVHFEDVEYSTPDR
jgi:uncharacterized alkaline shock family protein YloU